MNSASFICVAILFFGQLSSGKYNDFTFWTWVKSGSFDLPDYIEALADRISIIRDGVVVETGTLDQMRQRTRTTISATLERTPDGLGQLSGVHDVHREGERWVCSVEAGAINAAMAELTRYSITSLTVAPPSLSDLFLAHYGEELAEATA